MQNKDYLKKKFKNFSEFIAIASARELEYFITDAEYTSAFNYRMKKLLEEIKKERKSDLNLSVLFNTKGEVALISSEIIGSFISDNYTILIEKYYKNKPLTKIISEVIDGTEKAKIDFVVISYSVLYDTLNELYKELKCKKEVHIRLQRKFGIESYKKKDSLMVTAVYLILEDICKGIGIENYKMTEYTKDLLLFKSK